MNFNNQNVDDLAREQVLRTAQALIRMAESVGMVVTISTMPRLPLAMGSHDMVADVRESRALYAPKMVEAHRAKAAGEPYDPRYL